MKGKTSRKRKEKKEMKMERPTWEKSIWNCPYCGSYNIHFTTGVAYCNYCHRPIFYNDY